MNNSFDLIPHIVVNPTSVVSYNEVVWRKPSSKSTVRFIGTEIPIELQSKFLSSKRTSEGKVSDQARRKISKAIEYLISTSSQQKQLNKLTGKMVAFRITFLTLTLPSTQIHDDKTIINICLNSFLTECRKIYKLENYVWRAELQKNGNIHFHLASNKFIPWWEARNRWNRIVNKLGYVDRFHEKHGHKTPNSTDIHATRKIKNLKGYLMKYMSKDVNKPIDENLPEDYQRIQSGRIWGCDQALSKARGLNLIIDSEIDNELKKVLTSPGVRKFESTYFTVYYFDYHLLLKSGANILFRYFSDYLFEHFKFSEQLKLAS